MQTVEWVVSQILQHGRVLRGYFGIYGASRPLARSMQRKLGTKFSTIIQVVEVDRSGPAGLGGIRPGDWLLALNGKGVDGMDGLYRLMAAHPPGHKVVVTIIRDGTSAMNVEVVLGSDQPSLRQLSGGR
jgi:S1-C subfamily serine protease